MRNYIVITAAPPVKRSLSRGNATHHMVGRKDSRVAARSNAGLVRGRPRREPDRHSSEVQLRITAIRHQEAANDRVLHSAFIGLIHHHGRVDGSVCQIQSEGYGPNHRGQTFIKRLRWIPPSLLGGGKRRFAVGELGC